MRVLSLSCLALAFFPILGCRAQPISQGVDDSRLRSADEDKANWLTYGRTYNEASSAESVGD